MLTNFINVIVVDFCSLDVFSCICQVLALWPEEKCEKRGIFFFFHMCFLCNGFGLWHATMSGTIQIFLTLCVSLNTTVETELGQCVIHYHLWQSDPQIRIQSI